MTATVKSQVLLLLERVTTDRFFTPDPPASLNDLSFKVDDSTGVFTAALQSDMKIANRTAIAVIKLFEGLQPTEKQVAGFAIANASSKQNGPVTGALVLALGLSPFILPVKGSPALWLARGLEPALKAMPRLPTDDELAHILAWAGSPDSPPRTLGDVVTSGLIPQALNSLVQTLRDVFRFRLLESVLRDANPVVDRDRRELLGRLSKLAVSNEVSALLHQADLNADDGDYKAALDKVRTFLEQVLAQVGKLEVEAAPPPGTASSPPPSRFKRAKDHLVSRKLISIDEGTVLQALYNFLSNEGSHSVGSTPELYNVARVTVIEWSLLVTGRSKHN